MRRWFQFSLARSNQIVRARWVFAAGVDVGVASWTAANWGDRDMLSRWWWSLLIPYALFGGVSLYLGDRLLKYHERHRG
jgi:hypothetical protein